MNVILEISTIRWSEPGESNVRSGPKSGGQVMNIKQT